MKRLVIFILLVSFAAPAYGQDAATSQKAAPNQDQDTTGEAENLPESDKTPANPHSTQGILKFVVDSDKNSYPVLVVQPVKLRDEMISVIQEKFVPTEEVATDDDDADTKSKHKLVQIAATLKVVQADSQSPVFVPLKVSMPCYKFSNGDIQKANLSELGANTHVLVTGSIDDAMEVADLMRGVINAQAVLTGTKPRLPSYIVALSSTPKAEQTKSLAEVLNHCSPYLGKAEFFSDMKLRDSTYKKEVKRPAHPLPVYPIQYFYY